MPSGSEQIERKSYRRSLLSEENGTLCAILCYRTTGGRYEESDGERSTKSEQKPKNRLKVKWHELCGTERDQFSSPLLNLSILQSKEELNPLT